MKEEEDDGRQGSAVHGSTSWYLGVHIWAACSETVTLPVRKRDIGFFQRSGVVLPAAAERHPTSWQIFNAVSSGSLIQVHQAILLLGTAIDTRLSRGRARPEAAAMALATASHLMRFRTQ